MFNLIQLPNLRWIPKALSLSPSPQTPSPTQLAKDTIQEDVRYFILIRHTVLLINNNRKKFNQHLLRVFKMLSQNCYLSVTYPTIKHHWHTIAIFIIYASKNANSKNTPSTTKSTAKLQSRNTFLVVLSSPLQDTPILKIDQLKCL